MDSQKFLVRVVRPVFQAAYVEIEARDEKEAASKAFTSAYKLPEEKWSGRFDPEDYLFDVHCVGSGETPEGHGFSLLDFPKYGLLSTNQAPYVHTFAGQPWMNDVSPMTVAALYSKWIDGMLGERGRYYEATIEFFEERLKALRGSDQKVVPLVPPEERRNEIALIEAALNIAYLLNEVD